MVNFMLLSHVVIVPVIVPVLSGNTGWAKQTRPPQYPSKFANRWPLTNTIPTQDARRLLDDARARVTSERDAIKRLAHERAS
jgi:hypothetical protein